MIPVRYGSKRVKCKNLRLINGKPLISYIIETTLKANEKYKLFDEIYINSENEIFKKIADEYGIKFYKRPDCLSLDHVQNDDYAYDFILNNKCDILVQLLATSPFITVNEIKECVDMMLKNDYGTVKTINNIFIECTLNSKPINYNQYDKTILSQNITPVQQNVGAIMCWNCDTFKKNMGKYNAAYNGGDGSVGFYPIKGFSLVDIDHEEDFLLASVIAKIDNSELTKKEYFE